MSAYCPVPPELERESRARILAAGYRLFVEHGYKAVSMQQIADAAQIHKATLYHHFLNKEALFAAVILLAYGQLRADVAGIIDGGGTALDQLTAVASQMFANSGSDWGRLMTDVHQNIAPEQRDAILKDESYPWDLFDLIILRAIENGELPEIDPSLAISSFLGMVWGQIWVRKLDRIVAPLSEELARTVVELLFAGLRYGGAPAAAQNAMAVGPERWRS
jgi:AcrR family transcriptional regulator